MSEKAFYITTPLYYVNSKPHIGHAYTNILCDAFARYYRFKGEEVFFMTGTDEHGTKIEKAAEANGMSAKEYVDSIVPHFKELWDRLGIKHDYFIRTTDEKHKQVVHSVIRDLEKKGDIYRSTYEGWYSVKSETFYSESELVDGKCPDTGGEVQKIHEENYFFKLSNYQEWLINYIENNDRFIFPEMRKNEILGFLKQDLEDLCITRPKERLEWGIPYPGNEDYVIYVWFDALINYISGIDYSLDEKQFASHWPVDMHVIGKDILRHHAVYWPIMLKACGIEMPKTILAHGWWTLQGAKVSKSSGNAVDPMELIDKYGVDAFRYFLMNEVTIGMDGAYSEDLVRERYRTDLSNDLGNLWFRLASMTNKYFEGIVPVVDKGVDQMPLLKQSYELYQKVDQAMQQLNPRDALMSIWSVISGINQYIEERQPWKAAKYPEKQEHLKETLFVVADCLAHVSVILQAFLPATSQILLEKFDLDMKTVTEASEFEKCFIREDLSLNRGEPLFPRLEDIDEKVTNA